jgi:hypothetical protein
LTPGKIGLGDQHFDRCEWRRDRRRMRRRRLTAGSQIRGDPAGGESDTEYNETRGFHYASLSTGRHGRTRLSVLDFSS